jgi:hypothetical protein
MTDRTGDPAKKPPECKTSEFPTRCPHLVDVTPKSFETETYSCEVCGEYFRLYYSEMQ